MTGKATNLLLHKTADEDAIKAAEAAVEALQARLDTLEATLSEYDNLGAEISLLNKLKEEGWKR